MELLGFFSDVCEILRFVNNERKNLTIEPVQKIVNNIDRYQLLNNNGMLKYCF